ncbi:ORF2 [torque teno Delphinidae virus 40]
MGLTGKERGWLQLCLDSHSLFCDCEDPLSHLTRCLTEHTEEEALTIAAIGDINLTTTDGDGAPGDTDTGPGGTGDRSTVG